MISIVIPTYNRSNLVLRAIQSVQKQGIEDMEIIIVDDGSTDDTSKVIKELNDTRIRYIFQENGGVSKARNTGMKAAKGNYIALLDSDDILKAFSLLYRSRFLDENPQYDGITGSFIELGMDNKIIFGKSSPSPERMRGFDIKYRLAWAGNREKMAEIFKEYIINTNGGIPYICSSVMVRKKIIEDGLLFNEKLRNSEDLEFLFKMTKNYFIKFDFLRVDGYYQLQPTGLSGNIKSGRTIDQRQLALDIINNL